MKKTKRKPKLRKYPAWSDCIYFTIGDADENLCSCAFTPTGADRKMRPDEKRKVCIGLPTCAVYGTPKGCYRP